MRTKACRYIELAARINALRPVMAALTDGQLAGKTAELRQRLRAFDAAQQGVAGDGGGEAGQGELRQGLRRRGGPSLLGGMPESVVVESFAVVREAAQRVLGIRHYDVQLVGALLALPCRPAVWPALLPDVYTHLPMPRQRGRLPHPCSSFRRLPLCACACPTCTSFPDCCWGGFHCWPSLVFEPNPTLTSLPHTPPARSAAGRAGAARRAGGGDGDGGGQDAGSHAAGLCECADRRDGESLWRAASCAVPRDVCVQWCARLCFLPSVCWQALVTQCPSGRCPGRSGRGPASPACHAAMWAPHVADHAESADSSSLLPPRYATHAASPCLPAPRSLGIATVRSSPPTSAHVSRIHAAGRGVHVVTVNDYLAKRDAEW